MKKILVIGGGADHMQRWFHYVVNALPSDIHVDIFSVSGSTDSYEGAGAVYSAPPLSLPYRFLAKMPKLRVIVFNKNRNDALKKIIKNGHYDIINIHQPSAWMKCSMEYASKLDCKIILTPWGSDVLRCSAFERGKIKALFHICNFVTCNIPAFFNQYASLYSVDKSKLVNAGFGSEIVEQINHLKGRFSKEELSKSLAIPRANYYIACGYNASKSQRHLEMIDAIGVNKSYLPHNTLLVFQFSYGSNNDSNYKEEIICKCRQYGLDFFFVQSYLSNEDMAKYRLLMDLFLHLQPTDAANASLQEFLLADTVCINGGWLKYPQLEKEEPPYIICKDLKCLDETIRGYFSGSYPPPVLSTSARQFIESISWNNVKTAWVNFFVSL